MQHKNENMNFLIKHCGEAIRKYREDNTTISLNIFAYENEISKGNLSRIELGQVDTKLTSLWKIAEGFGMPLSKLIAIIEKDLPEDFSLIDK